MTTNFHLKRKRSLVTVGQKSVENISTESFRYIFPAKMTFSVCFYACQITCIEGFGEKLNSKIISLCIMDLTYSL